jgi:hypothetical protein
MQHGLLLETGSSKHEIALFSYPENLSQTPASVPLVDTVLWAQSAELFTPGSAYCLVWTGLRQVPSSRTKGTFDRQAIKAS